ncbi:Gibberellin-regulated protein 13 [Raphanus sativus]|uniref:Gibberellin-regulated protein 13 n=1 Tax=Raphanus sativus TaxID=3726 RepID=A0A6J0JDW1_RAPSA|nr:gibberellin-regulated protein 13 [Raphanus sativus]KAJ4872330.1 Gibberellin-regulated protein 13 [Raphanus sativus]
MATNLNTIVLSIVMLHLGLTAQMHPIHLESPAPQPHPPQSQPQPPHHNSSQYGTTEGSLQPQECGPRCGDRCSNTQYKKPCLFFCNKCCAKCLCVPPGTYGNKQVCPCYNNWKTQLGGPKCP